MAVTAANIKKRLSVKTGAAGDTTASTPAASLGKYASTTEVVDASDNNLFDDASRAESEAGDIEYRCFFYYNNHATDSWFDVVVWIESQVADGATIAIGIDPAAASDIDAAPAQAAEIADETAAPASVTFSTPTDVATGLSLGTLTADQCRAVWVRRTVPGGVAAKTADGAKIRARGFPTA